MAAPRDLAPDFEPHGLITSPFLESDYRSTRTYPPEVRTQALLEDIFNKVLFKDRHDVTVNSFRQYDHADPGKCHFVVKYFDKEDIQREILCFTQDVRDLDHKARCMPIMGEFEAHVVLYCRKHLEAKHGLLKFVYVCTAFGTCLRVWKQFFGDYELGGLWGGYGPTVDISSYLDVGNDDSSRQIQQALDQITNQSWEPGNKDTTRFYSETSPRKVDTWLEVDESGVAVRCFLSQGKWIMIKYGDWKKANSGSFLKKRLIYQNGEHNVWTELWRWDK